MEKKQKKRSEVADEFKWRIGDIFGSDEAWRSALDETSALAAAFADKYRGKVTGANVEACLAEQDALSEKFMAVMVYARMKLDEDTNVPQSQGMADMAQGLFVKCLAAVSFVEPELLCINENDLPLHGKYKQYLNNILRKRSHIRSAEVEELLANAAEIGQAPDNVYGMMTDADMKFGFITDENGEQIELTQSRFIPFMESQDRRVRKDAFETYYSAFKKQINTLAALYSSSVKKDVFFAKSKNFTSALDAALFENNIPLSVYSNLIETIHEFLPAMHAYMRLRKKALGVSELHMYDIYTPIVPSFDAKVSYDEAKKGVAEGLAPLGADYVGTAGRGMDGGWIDVYENEGKRSGAYAWGVFGVHPFILLNYENKLDDMFTLAHEIGHAMHSYYSWESQPYVYSDYTIFLAEVASTVNETLLMEHLLDKTTDKKMRAYLINHFLEQFRGTVFRQTMFAEFEMLTHEMAERGEPLTAETINFLYRGLNEKYYGPDMIVDEQINLEWARIPHFYSAFYVYQYATGFSAAVAFANHIKEKGPESYKSFLSAGSSDYSIEILKKAGVDMSETRPVREALALFTSLVSKMEEALEL
ncbi:MAG: oligoendopeptidase F [Defluviitaleaceae bacterium]|nr:oligoendopeptidase F [Defluviitaleaceae bacterium]